MPRPPPQHIEQAQRIGGDRRREPAAVRRPFAGLRRAGRAVRDTGERTPGVPDEQLGLAEHQRRQIVGVGVDAPAGVPDGAPDDLLAHRAAFGVVTPQQAGTGLAPHHERELPAQVHGVLDTRVHALGAGRRMDVGGVARDEDPPRPVPVDDAVAHPEDRGPAQSGEPRGTRREPVDDGLQPVEPRPRAPSRPCATPSGADAAGADGTRIDIRYRPAPGSGTQTSTSSADPSSVRWTDRSTYPGGRSQSATTSPSMYDSGNAPPSYDRPSVLRTRLCAPSQPIR
ncbi:hypothetical protein ASE09_26800 [Streptomyces sp. Root66D1]|nr:hypothetical protein ASD33_29990 [Streptomyces sp. Root1304]KRA97094.1 hypothetical protein ASE09_26800 [Streptomyces sp. Root66D1]